MYNPANRPNRPKALQENEETRRLMSENAQLRADLATALTTIETQKREVDKNEHLRDELAKARRGRDWWRGRAETALAGEAAAREEARMCRTTIKELRDNNQILQDRLVIACA